MSQREKILKYLLTGRPLTPLQALNWWGCMRLGGRIWELRDQGYAITTTTKAVKNRDGKRCYVAEYRLEGK
jgi:hypothetical protein